jgi:hypothetical protein
MIPISILYVVFGVVAFYLEFRELFMRYALH